MLPWASACRHPLYLLFFGGGGVLDWFLFFFFMPAPVAYAGSQARGRVRVAAAGLCHSSQQRQILNPLSEARAWTRVLVATSRILNLLSPDGTSSSGCCVLSASLAVFLSELMSLHSGVCSHSLSLAQWLCGSKAYINHHIDASLFYTDNFAYGNSPLAVPPLGLWCHSLLFFSFLPFLGLLLWHIGGSQARGLIGAVAARLCQSHSNVGSEPRLQSTPQLVATLDR